MAHDVHRLARFALATREIGVRPPGPYPAARADDRRPTLALSAWAQYVLDDYAAAARLKTSSTSESALRRPDPRQLTLDGVDRAVRAACSSRSARACSAVFRRRSRFIASNAAAITGSRWSERRSVGQGVVSRNDSAR